jgi:hypothetical protein
VAKGKPAGSKGARPGKPTKALVECCRKQHAGGNPLMLLIAVDACLRTGRKVPRWAAQEFSDRIENWFRAQVKTLDEAFGVQRPPGEHSAGRKKRELLRPYIVLRVLALNTFQGVPIDDGMFERVARELKVSGLKVAGSYVKKVYYQRDSHALRALRPFLRSVTIS